MSPHGDLWCGNSAGPCPDCSAGWGESLTDWKLQRCYLPSDYYKRHRRILIECSCGATWWESDE